MIAILVIFLQLYCFNIVLYILCGWQLAAAELQFAAGEYVVVGHISAIT